MMSTRKSVIQQVIVLLAVLATFCSWPAVSGSLKGSAEKLIDQRLQTDSLFSTAGFTPSTQTASKPISSKGGTYSSATVWSTVKDREASSAWQECNGLNCVLAYMKKSGASEESMNFTREISQEVFGILGYLETFEEKGRVDLGVVALPGVMTFDSALVLLNGSPSLVSPNNYNTLDISQSQDPNYPRLKKQYPELRAFEPSGNFISVDASSDGGQRFIFAYILVDGCHGCGVNWTASVAFDFSRDGTFKGTKVLKLTESVSDSVGSQSTGLPSADLLSRIDKALSRLPKPSDYLYETTSVRGQISGTWTEITARILGTKDLRVAYDNFYQSSVEYAGMVEINLRRAKKAVMNNDPVTGSRLLQAAQRYERQFYLNDRAAIEAFNGNIDAAAELARGTYEGSKAATIYGSSMVLGPVGSRVVDTVFDATDFAVEASDSGLTSAAKKLVAGKLTEMIFSQATVTTLGGRTLEDAIDRGVTKTLGNPEVYKIVREVVSKPEFAKAFMGFMAKSGSHVVSSLTEDQVNKIVLAVMEGVASKAPPLTDCGSKWYQRLGLQFLEVEQAIRGGYSFNTVCQAHDACYGDCRTLKPECDKKLLTDAEGVCESAQNRANCIADAQIFFQVVSSEKGDTPFEQARANCPATVGLPPIPYEDSGACPFEGCVYRKWIANKEVPMRTDMKRDALIKFTVNKGEKVTALTGIVVTTTPGEAKVLKPIVIGGITANVGDVVYILTYQGEGISTLWYKGKIWNPGPDEDNASIRDSLEYEKASESTWWVQVKNRKGQVGWTNQPDDFSNKDLFD